VNRVLELRFSRTDIASKNLIKSEVAIWSENMWKDAWVNAADGRYCLMLDFSGSSVSEDMIFSLNRAQQFFLWRARAGSLDRLILTSRDR
jgi:hypothetical protein